MPRTRYSLLGAVLAAAAVGLGPADAQATPRSGVWAGNGAVLTLHDQGGRLDFDCGYATLPSPVTPDRKGRFKAVSAYFPAQAGLVDADKPAVRIAARIEGAFTGESLRITFMPAGGAPATFDLTPGKARKLIRCM